MLQYKTKMFPEGTKQLRFDINYGNINYFPSKVGSKPHNFKILILVLTNHPTLI
jgi:hypothetical protein